MACEWCGQRGPGASLDELGRCADCRESGSLFSSALVSAGALVPSGHASRLARSSSRRASSGVSTGPSSAAGRGPGG